MPTSEELLAQLAALQDQARQVAEQAQVALVTEWLAREGKPEKLAKAVRLRRRGDGQGSDLT